MTTAIDEQAATAESEVPAVHLARCTQCAAGAKVQPLRSGHGFTVLERYGVDVDTAFGVGPNGRPECPQGHGEMSYADETLPAHEAIADTAAKVEEARRLPFPTPPVNYEGFTHSIFTKRHEVAVLERKFNDLSERRKQVKDDLDSANEQLGKMIDEFEQLEKDRKDEIERKARQDAEGHPEGTNLVRCTFEQTHPDTPCPICTDPEGAAQKGLTAQPTAPVHEHEACRYLVILDVEDTQLLLRNMAKVLVDEATIEGWAPPQRLEVRTWCEAMAEWRARAVGTDGQVDEAVPTPPAFMGRPHEARITGVGDPLQICAWCGSTLVELKTGDAYPAGQLVGTDCPGAHAEATHRYPKRGKKKGGQA